MDVPARVQLSQYFGTPPSTFHFQDKEPEIGSGAYGCVYPGELNGRPVAVKRIHSLLLEACETHVSRSKLVKSFENECHQMERLNHPRLVAFLGAYRDAKGPFLVMDRLVQDLRRFLIRNKGKLSLRKQFQLCLDIASGLHYLHSQKPPLIHRDLTDKNILIDKDGKASIADLGQSKLKIHPYQYFNTMAPGAAVFMPPEALRRNAHYNEKVDIFSLGVLILEITTQLEPSPGLLAIDVVDETERRKEELDRLPDAHPLRQLILSCLNNDYHKRPCISQLYETLQQLAEPAELFKQAKESLQAAVILLDAALCKITALARESETISDSLEEAKARMIVAKTIADRSERKVVFFGRTSNGKSTLINALLQCDILFTGYGAVTSYFCLIKGQSESTGGYVKLESSEKLPMEDTSQFKEYIEERAQPTDSTLKLYWSTAQCPILSGDIALVDSPGLSARNGTDAKVIEHCVDADVLVYVCDGKATFETGEQALFEKVKLSVSNPCNTFIVFNQWDVVEKKRGADRVKQQHLERVNEILVENLHIYNTEMAQKRTFFLSAEEALTMCDMQHQTSPNAQSGELKRQQEFQKFRRLMQECLDEATIATKIGRHHSACVKTVEDVMVTLNRMEDQLKDKQSELEREKASKTSILRKIVADKETLEEISEEHVQSALKILDALFDDMHEKIKKTLLGEIAVYRPKSDKEKWADYQAGMIEHLDEARKEVMESSEELMSTFVIDRMASLQAAIEEAQAKIDQHSLSLEQPACVDLARGYRARPKFTRFVRDSSHSFLKDVRSAWKTNPHADSSFEFITLNGLECKVPKWFKHSAGSDFWEVFFWIGASTIAAPLGAASLSVLGYKWLTDKDNEHLDQVKGKINDHLNSDLDAWKEDIKSKHLKSLRGSFQSQVECLSKGLADKEKVLNQDLGDLEQRIAHYPAWIDQVNDYRKELLELQRRLDDFCSVYLQGEC